MFFLVAFVCVLFQNFSYFLLAYILIVVYGLVVMQAERQGEMFASVSGSLMVKFEFDSSLSPHTSSQVSHFSFACVKL